MGLVQAPSFAPAVERELEQAPRPFRRYGTVQRKLFP